MPYVTNRTLTVGEFRGSSKSPTLWTEKRCMQAWNSQRYAFGGPIPVGYAFKRPWEGGHSNFSQHYAGLAFDAGQTLSVARRAQLYTSALNSNVWSYVEPKSLTPTWVHFDKRRRHTCLFYWWFSNNKKRFKRLLCINCTRLFKHIRI